MPKTYIVDNLGPGNRTTIAAPVASGSQVHLIDAGPTLGLIRAYSGSVTGNFSYLVDNGPSLGRERSAT
jgi:hypothetical protein